MDKLYKKHLVNCSSVRSFVKGSFGKMNVSVSFWEKLDSELKKLIEQSVERSRANGRNTILDRDL